MDVRGVVHCHSVYEALVGLVKALFVADEPFIDIESADPRDTPAEDPVAEFVRLCTVLFQAKLLNEDAPIDEARGGRHRIRVPNPRDRALQLPFRIRLVAGLEPAAVVLHVFQLLRVRYQAASNGAPLARLEATIDDDASVDLLYMVGDAFTERYPVESSLERNGERIILSLRGERARITGGLAWSRGRYISTRDASLLVRVLRDSLVGSSGPFVVPRSAATGSAYVRARLPTALVSTTSNVRWLESLRELSVRPPVGPTLQAGNEGEHFSARVDRCGHVAAMDTGGATRVVSVRVDESQAASVGVVLETPETLGVTFEAIGGAREIGANSYVYSFGHRRLIVDVGFDATRDGWLGLPAFERLVSADVLVLTHAHLDHVGSLPLILAWFPNLVVYCTSATRAVLTPQLNDSAKIGGLRFSETGEPPAFERGLVDGIRFERFRVAPYGTPMPVPEIPGLTLEFRDAGHIIGSAGIHMAFGSTSIFHTGDISVEDQYLSHGMAVNDCIADHVVMEGTYCGEPEFTREDRRAAVERFLSSLEKQLEGGGSVLVPAFSLGRAQELVGLIVDWRERTGRNVPIFTVGLVNVLNEISAAHPEFLPGLKGKPFSKVREFPRVKGDGDARRIAFANAFARIASQSPSIVIASHGMMAENTGSYLIGRAILTGDDRRHAIFLCGYMDPRTPGFRLRTQCDAPTIEYGMGDLIARNIPSENIQFHRLTAHASYDELCEVAVRAPARSVTFIHGDGVGLDRLKADVETRLVAVGKDVRVRAPGIGERFELARVPRTIEWDLQQRGRAEPALGSGRRLEGQRRGLSVGGLSEDRNWALVPVGSSVSTLSLELDRVALSAISRVEIRGGGHRATAYERGGQGELSRIEWGVLGRATWIVDGEDPGGAVTSASFQVAYGAEFRPVRRVLDAVQPVLEFQVGGTHTPSAIYVGDASGWALSITEQEWHEPARLLRVRLSPFGVGPIRDLRLKVRWPDGFVQDGPALGDFEAVPAVEFRNSTASAAIAIVLPLKAVPTPLAARVGKVRATITPTTIAFTPRHPGLNAVELQYRSPGGETTWREVASVDVRPSALLSVSPVVAVGSQTSVTVSSVDSRLHLKQLALRIGQRNVATWTADGSAFQWTGEFDEPDVFDVAVVLQDNAEVLCVAAMEVVAGARLDVDDSLLVATADGRLLAETFWHLANESERGVIEAGVVRAGFEIARWDGARLLFAGRPATLGIRAVTVETRPVSGFNVLTLPDVDIQVRVTSSLRAGTVATVALSSSALADGLLDSNDGLLTLEVDRVAPVFDSLSSVVKGSGVRFIHAGEYSVALCSGDRRLAELRVAVEGPLLPVLESAENEVDVVDETLFDASASIAMLPPRSGTAVFGDLQGRYRTIQSAAAIEEQAWVFIRDQMESDVKVAVVWPGLALGALAGRLMARLRQEFPARTVAHLSYPAPRGELVLDADAARRVRQHRVLCCAPANSFLDRGDAYHCPRCAGTPGWRTDDRQIWLHCGKCGFDDRDVILTLNAFRSADVSVLFADYRIARYLRQGSGARYAGTFGRSVRCASCHRPQVAFSQPTPWNGAELQTLLSELSSTWDASNVELSVRRAARRVARRSFGSSDADSRRLKEALHRLIDAQAVVDGRPTNLISRVEAGRSLCCDGELKWAPRKVAHVFLAVEELLHPGFPPSAHPDLSFGESAIRQFLTLHS